MNRPVAALAAAIAATVSVAGCANAGALAGHGKKLPRMPALLHGKYQALAVSFPDRVAGIASISGYPGKSVTLRSWINRTADGGQSWVASGPASGQHQPGAQAGMAFVSAAQGWAFLMPGHHLRDEPRRRCAAAPGGPADGDRDRRSDAAADRIGGVGAADGTASAFPAPPRNDQRRGPLMDCPAVAVS